MLKTRFSFPIPHTVIIIFHSVSQFCPFSTIFPLRSFHPLHINLLLSYLFPPLLFTSTLPLPQILQVCFLSVCLGLSPFSIILPSSSSPRNSVYHFLFKFLNHPFNRDKNCPLQILSLLFSFLPACQNAFFVTPPLTLFQSKTHAIEALFLLL